MLSHKMHDRLLSVIKHGTVLPPIAIKTHILAKMLHSPTNKVPLSLVTHIKVAQLKTLEPCFSFLLSIRSIQRDGCSQKPLDMLA